MTSVTLVDTGPLVAMLDRNDRQHKWTVATLASVEGALVTCEPVLTEACFLLKRYHSSSDSISSCSRVNCSVSTSNWPESTSGCSN